MQNNIEKGLELIGQMVLGIGGIAGFILLFNPPFLFGGLVLVASILIGLLMMGFAENIRVLKRIEKRLEKQK